MNLKQQFVVILGAIVIGWLTGSTASVYGEGTGLIIAVVSFFGSTIVMIQLITERKRQKV